MASHPDRGSRWAVFLVALGASLWATDVLFRHLLTRTLSSAATVFCEHLILVALLSPWLWRSRKRWGDLGARGWAATLGIGWGGSALGLICYTEAIRLGEPATAALLQKLQPIFAALLAAVLLGEREPRRIGYWVRAAAALAAALVVSFGTEAPSLSDLRAQAALYAAAAAFIWGSSTVLGRYLLRYFDPLELTALRVTTALPLLGFLARNEDLPGLDPSLWGLIAGMALIPGLLALAVYYRGLQGTPASLATLAELCFSVVAVSLKKAFLGAELSAVQITAVLAWWAAVLWRGPRGAKALKS